MDLLKSRVMSTTLRSEAELMWIPAVFVHSPDRAENGLVERMLYDHPQSTGSTTATSFKRSIK